MIYYNYLVIIVLGSWSARETPMTSISFATVSQPRFRVRPAVWLSAMGSILLLVAYTWIASALLHAASAPESVSAAPTSQVTKVTHAQTATKAPAPTTQAAAASENPTPCTPLSFGLPSSLSLDNAAAGLTLQNDPTTYYQIYGNTATNLRSQIQACAPGANGSASAEFTGQTAYTLSWQYSVIHNGSSCTLASVKVGMHTAIAMPYWQATGSAAAGLNTRWQSFVSGLAVHEQGHVSLNNLYAGKLLSSLQNLGPTDCGSVAGAVQSLANGTNNALNQANDAYDAQTNHGASQGAVVPSY